MKKAFSFFCAIILCISCKTAEFGTQCIDVNGMVYDFVNRPVSGYEIFAGENHKTITDITGRFTLMNLPKGLYQIIGRCDNYESYSGILDLKDKKQIVYIRIPTSSQLLDLADKSLTENRLEDAESYITRAEKTGRHITAELAFYSAVLLFRKNNNTGAIEVLKYILSTGVDDSYVKNFLNVLEKNKGNFNE
ncbi:MAG TPA: carboxypeptidase-like regulatory domain-containing protein [Treponemataceae bacterium]|nr:carboxypeptidase-like regulatory domain-containing protein [Treponemataceae bacterium]